VAEFLNLYLGSAAVVHCGRHSLIYWPLGSMAMVIKSRITFYSILFYSIYILGFLFYSIDTILSRLTNFNLRSILVLSRGELGNLIIYFSRQIFPRSGT
jgi:hypothetical protein